MTKWKAAALLTNAAMLLTEVATLQPFITTLGANIEAHDSCRICYTFGRLTAPIRLVTAPRAVTHNFCSEVAAISHIRNCAAFLMAKWNAAALLTNTAMLLTEAATLQPFITTPGANIDAHDSCSICYTFGKLKASIRDVTDPRSVNQKDSEEVA